MFFYPGTGKKSEIGRGEGVGKNVNIPVSYSKAGDLEFVQAFERVFIPIIREFSPELILVSCGFDAARGDPLGGFDVTPKGYEKMTKILLEINPRVVLALEGGYNLDSISNSSVSVVRSLLGDKQINHSGYETPQSETTFREFWVKSDVKRMKNFDKILDSVIEIQKEY